MFVTAAFSLLPRTIRFDHTSLGMSKCRPKPIRLRQKARIGCIDDASSGYVRRKEHEKLHSMIFFVCGEFVLPKATIM